MGRVARNVLLYDGCHAHIISRSIEKRKVFLDNKDFEYFKKLLKEGKERFGFQIYHYCLMQTHFHLAVGIKELKSFSNGMKQLKWEYTRKYNRRHKRRGPLWQNRYKSLLIENEAYLTACGEYIEQNPVKASLVKQKEDWKHSSARHYLNLDNDPLIDGYEARCLSEPVDLTDMYEFEKGVGVGSDWFKFQLRKKAKES